MGDAGQNNTCLGLGLWCLRRERRRQPTPKTRRVTFDNRVAVYFQNRWSDREYRAARIGPWTHYAADRCRFNRFVREFDRRYGHIFTDIHRARMRELIERFIVLELSNDVMNVL